MPFKVPKPRICLIVGIREYGQTFYRSIRLPTRAAPSSRPVLTATERTPNEHSPEASVPLLPAPMLTMFVPQLAAWAMCTDDVFQSKMANTQYLAYSQRHRRRGSKVRLDVISYRMQNAGMALRDVSFHPHQTG